MAGIVKNLLHLVVEELTKIHDQPRRPRVPLIKLIPNASNPENAPASDAAPKKRPIRSWSL